MPCPSLMDGAVALHCLHMISWGQAYCLQGGGSVMIGVLRIRFSCSGSVAAQHTGRCRIKQMRAFPWAHLRSKCAMLCCDLLSLAARGEISASQNQRDSTTGTGQGATRESPVKLLEDQIRGKIKGCRRELVHVLTRPLAQIRQGALGWLTERPGVLIPAFQFFGSSCAVSGLCVRQKTLVTRWHRSCWMPPPYERGSPRSCRE